MSNSLIRNIDYKGFTIELHQDTDAGNPFREFDEYSDFIAWHRQYDLTTGKAFATIEEFKAFAKKHCVVFKPVFAYIHSGITIKGSNDGNPFSCQWDSGFLGYAYITRKRVDEMQGWKRLTAKRRAEVAKYLDNDIERYDSFLQGEVYGYVVKNEDGDQLDSCWGFYGDEKYCIEAAQEYVHYEVNQATLAK